MKFRKLTTWSGTKVSRERRKAEKEKNKVVNPGGKGASSCGSPTSILNKSQQLMNLLPRHKSEPFEKHEANITNADVLKSATANTGILSKIEGLEDNEDDNINDRKHANTKNNYSQITSQGNKIPVSPVADRNTPLTSTPNFSSHPPQEIMIDHLAVPPSPMREPNPNIMASPSMNKRLLDDRPPGLFLNFQEVSPREAKLRHHCVGDPVGDIAMQRQLMDAQRLVRLILGRQHVLGPSSILQAIRSFALMKAELVGLRTKQEVIDDDPPAILLALGSPAMTTPSTTRTSARSRRRSGMETPISNSDGTWESTEYRSDNIDANPNAPISPALEQANDTIQKLQKDLAAANDIIVEVEGKMNINEQGRRYQNATKLMNKIGDTEQPTQNDLLHDELIVEESKQDENPELVNESDCQKKKKSSNIIQDKNQATQNDKQHEKILVEESKQNGSFDLLLDEIVLIPHHVLTKDMVRQKLNLYHHAMTSHYTESQIIEMKKKMRQSQEESERRVLELEDKMRLQDQEHKKQIQAIITNKEHFVFTKTEKNKNTILTELSHNTTSNTGGHLSSSIRKPMGDKALKIDAQN